MAVHLQRPTIERLSVIGRLNVVLLEHGNLAATQHGSDARDQQPEAERLANEIIGAHFQAEKLINFFILLREENHGQTGLLPQSTQCVSIPSIRGILMSLGRFIMTLNTSPPALTRTDEVTYSISGAGRGRASLRYFFPDRASLEIKLVALQHQFIVRIVRRQRLYGRLSDQLKAQFAPDESSRSHQRLDWDSAHQFRVVGTDGAVIRTDRGDVADAGGDLPQVSRTRTVGRTGTADALVRATAGRSDKCFLCFSGLIRRSASSNSTALNGRTRAYVARREPRKSPS